MKDRTYFEEKFKKCPFYWGFLEISAELQLETLEELREIRKLLQKNGDKK